MMGIVVMMAMVAVFAIKSKVNADACAFFKKVNVNLYLGNENADGFIEEVIEVNEVNPVSILWELKQRNPVLENVEINHCSFDDGFLTIDFNRAFADVVCSMGTSGELMIVGSVVNTYLSALHTDSMYFTVEGEILESGHTVYDFVMSYFSLEN